MDEEDTPLLGGDDHQETKTDFGSVDLKKMVYFHGKELAGKSFIRNVSYNLIRLGIGKNGIYKLDSKTPTILEHWKFKEIRDSSYSGYSFILQLKGKQDYTIRTDDGEMICSYIDAFQKDPDKALEDALNNPPMSKIPESGLMTLRRKFSADPKPQSHLSNEIKYSTFDRRTARSMGSVDPYSRLVHNVKQDSQLRKGGSSLNARDNEARKSFSFENRPEILAKTNLETVRYSSASDVRSSPPKMNGTIAGPEKQLAREVLSQRIGEARDREKRYSNGINHSPISTKGEVTTTVSTKTSPLAASSNNKRSSSNSPLLRKKNIPEHLQEFNKAGSAPPTLPPEESERGGSGGGGEGSNSISKAPGMKELNTIGKQKKTTPTLVGVAHRKGRPPSDLSNEHTPLIRSESGSSELYSPSEDFSFISRSSPSLNQHADRPLSNSNSLKHASSGSSETYDRLEDYITPSKRYNSWETFSNSESGSAPGTPTVPMVTVSSRSSSSAYEDILSLPERRGSGSSSRTNSSAESGNYDHLPILVPNEQNLEVGVDPGIRKITSQPALSTPPSARESPSDQFGRFGSIDEEESSDEDEVGVTPTNSDDETAAKKADEEAQIKYEGVVLRRRKQQEDPFAELLSPRSSNRLRWSQELNPLYDYIKGFKADGVRLYDSSPVSKLMLSATAGSLEGRKVAGGVHNKPPSVIVEEEGEHSEWFLGKAGNEDTLSEISSEMPSSPSPSLPSIESEGDSLCGTLPKPRRQQHTYEDVNVWADPPTVSASMPNPPSPISFLNSVKRSESSGTRSPTDKQRQKQTLKSSTVTTEPVKRLHEMNKMGVSPRLGKREILQQRRSRVAAHDDTEAMKTKQRPIRAADALKDFSFVMREFRMFFVKMPNGFLLREIYSINKPISDLHEKLCDTLGVDNPEQYQLLVEGACLSSLHESETGVDVVRVNRVGSVDSQILPDQPDPITLKTNLSFRMQGITTSRILALRPLEPLESLHLSFSTEFPPEEDEYHKCWISVVQGNFPLTQEDAIRLSALHYQAYFLDRTAVNSVIGFCRPTEFLPVEYTGVRGIEQKMYKEQESLQKKSHAEIEEAYVDHCSCMDSYGAVFFPVREPRKKLLHSTKLKPVIFGVGPQGILRVDPKTKEVLGFWQYNVLKNWAYSKRTFVLAFTGKNFPIESNQACWISSLVDFFVNSIITTTVALKSKAEKSK